ncbi:hypothetical protein AAC03nite_37700 [Alicyclobacillus acidoterrestris]|uniref:hypothetical protein n=1 Tax=Alicyclobacillus suci TaxID=2816080 RepID=UPI001193FF4D|nr:hypothetical protein [Alicyclobacillus suci]GEO27985.1 hypothetical protein AAC03nite_37700 [Alicyclobacillus acidoterrestris]
MSDMERRLHHRKGAKVNIFTNDGNQIIGTLDSIEDGLVRLTNATVFKNFKRRLSDTTVFVVIDKINSFHRVRRSHHHHRHHHHHHKCHEHKHHRHNCCDCEE